MEGPQDPMAGRRIFVARIPPDVTEEQFRDYFGRYGRIDDAYMPRDRTRQAYRGIGFVTYSDAASTDSVISVRHRFGDHDIVVDRATPKNMQGSGHQAQSSGQGCSMDQTQFRNLMACQSAPTPGPPLASLATAIDLSSDGLASVPPPLQSAQFENQMKLFQVLREQQQHMGMANRPGGLIGMDQPQGGVSTPGIVLPPGLLPDLGVEQASSALASLMGSIPQGVGMMNPLPHGPQLDSGIFANLKDLAARALDSATRPPPMNANSLGSAMSSGGYPMVANDAPLPAPSVGSSQGGDTSRVSKARSGPRLFVGKLSKETSEQDLREHFSKFGFVMDVFMPRAKENKKGHRGFGFVTFETEAAIQRVVAHGTHKIRNSVIAIDVAVPEESAGA